MWNNGLYSLLICSATALQVCSMHYDCFHLQCQAPPTPPSSHKSVSPKISLPGLLYKVSQCLFEQECLRQSLPTSVDRRDWTRAVTEGNVHFNQEHVHDLECKIYFYRCSLTFAHEFNTMLKPTRAWQSYIQQYKLVKLNS